MNKEEKNIGNTEIAHLMDSTIPDIISGNDEKNARYDYMSAGEVAAFLGIGRTKAYELCNAINARLSQEGFLTFRGKIPRCALLDMLPH